jgi:hypothetical protein
VHTPRCTGVCTAVPLRILSEPRPVSERGAGRPGLAGDQQQRAHRRELRTLLLLDRVRHLGFGRTVASEIEVPNMLVNMV